MQKLIISNVRSAEYNNRNLNKIFEPDGKHKQSFEFDNSPVNNPYKDGGKLSACFYTLQPGKVHMQK